MEKQSNQEEIAGGDIQSPEEDKSVTVQEPEVLPPSDEVQADDDLVERAVQTIKEKYHETVYKGALEIGEFILREFFGNDEKLTSSRNPKKAASYRKLKEREDLPISKSTLHDMVNVARQERFFNEHNLDTSALSYTHKCKLIRLPNDDAKIRFIREKIVGMISVRALALLVQDEKNASKKPTSQDSSTSTPPSKTVKELKGLLTDSWIKTLDLNPDELKKLGSEEKKELEEKISDTVKKLSAAMKAYKNIVKELKGMPDKEDP